MWMRILLTKYSTVRLRDDCVVVIEVCPHVTGAVMDAGFTADLQTLSAGSTPSGPVLNPCSFKLHFMLNLVSEVTLKFRTTYKRENPDNLRGLISLKKIWQAPGYCPHVKLG
jgi:hypothetical protein